ncbi:hypothetical protein EYF80_059938 [Liparis tanakae]|uniref:Uncharacterized protein n=1 Tax=Liparis tanakae TaxID=230148 RepID=A0A4Z2ENF6_9TELE|nr:hypothetical protein EYF80_059938 [Liparis tanakae]
MDARDLRSFSTLTTQVTRDEQPPLISLLHHRGPGGRGLRAEGLIGIPVGSGRTGPDTPASLSFGDGRWS